MESFNALSAYGPIAFGTIVLLIIWKAVVKPELDARRLDTQTFQSSLGVHLDKLAVLTAQVRETAQIQAVNTTAMMELVKEQRALLDELRSAPRQS